MIYVSLTLSQNTKLGSAIGKMWYHTELDTILSKEQISGYPHNRG